MAYGDLGFMAPREAYYTGPRGRTDVARVEATKRAAYLSSMDQFYAGLEESERQFDIGTRLAEERQEWEEEYGTRVLDIEEAGLEWREEYGTRELDIRESIAKWTEEIQEREFEWRAEFGEAELDWRKELGQLQAETQLTVARLGYGAQKYTARLGLEAKEMEFDWAREEAEMTKGFLEDYFREFGELGV